MVYDHDIGLQRLTPGHVDKTALKLGAAGAQTVFTGGGHHRDHCGTLVQPRQLGQIAGPCGQRPDLQVGQGLDGRTVLLPHIKPGVVQPVKTQITGPTLEQRNPNRATQRSNQPWQISTEKLILQGFGCC